MCWLIDPNDRSVIIYRIDRNTEVVDEPSAMLPVPDIDRTNVWLVKLDVVNIHQAVLSSPGKFS